MAKKAVETETVQEPLISESMTQGVDGSVNEFDDFGLEGARATLSQIPVIKLTQSMTPEVQDRDLKEIYAGMMIDDSTKVVLPDPLTVRILRAWRCRVKYAPRGSGGNPIECSCPTYMHPAGDHGSEYGECSRCMFNNFNEMDHCQVQYQMVVAREDNPNDRYRVILTKSSYKAGRKLDNAFQSLRLKYRNMPSYMFKVQLSVEEMTNHKIGSKYYIFKVDVVPPKPGEELLAPELRDAFKEAFLEIQELRKESLDYHMSRVEAKRNEDAAMIANNGAASDFASMGAEISSAFEKDVEPVSKVIGSEDIPF